MKYQQQQRSTNKITLNHFHFYCHRHTNNFCDCASWDIEKRREFSYNDSTLNTFYRDFVQQTIQKERKKNKKNNSIEWANLPNVTV